MFCPRTEEARAALDWKFISIGVQLLGGPCHALAIGCGMACRFTSNLESLSITMGPSNHLPSPPTAQQPHTGRDCGVLGRQRRDLDTIVRGAWVPLL